MNVIKYMFGADSKQYESTMERIKRSTHEATSKISDTFAKVGAAIAGYLSFAAVKRLVDEAMSYFDNLNHKAEQIGQSATFIAAFEDAMRGVGGSTQQADKALSDFTKKWGEAQAGAGELVKVFDTFGISLKNADGSARSVQEGLMLMAEAIKNAQSPQEQLYLSTKAFGEEAGVKMVEILKQGGDGLAFMAAQFKLANPELDAHAKNLSAASQELTDLKESIIIMAGTWVSKIREMFGDGLQKGIATFQSMVEEVFFSLISTSLKFTEKLTFGMVDAEAMIEEERAKLDSKQQERFAKIIEQSQARQAAEDAISEEAVKTTQAYKDMVEQKNKLLEQDANRIPAEAAVATEAERVKTEYEKAAEAAAKIKENVDKATDATNNLADAAGKIDYPNGPTGGGGGGTWRDELQLGNTGSGGGYFGVFDGMGDPAQMSVEDIISASRKLEKQLAELKGKATLDMLQINKTYIRQIEDIMAALNEELYVRAKAETGGKANIPDAGFFTPEQYFKRLDDFIERLYDKDMEKSSLDVKTEKAAMKQAEATKSLASALERFSGSLERSQKSKFGTSIRP